MNRTQRLPNIEPWQHWNSERLRQEKEGNPRSFARGFQMRAFSDSERMFPSFPTCYANGIVTGELARRGWPVFVGVDLAGDKRPGNVIFVAAVDPVTQRRYPLEVNAGAWTSPETARQLAAVHSRHPNVRVIMVENNGYQQSLVDWIRNSPADQAFWFKIECYTTGQNSKINPTYGLPSLEVEFKNKAWAVPADEFEGHPVTCRCGWCVWVQETKDYPMGATTDTVMAMFFCREAIAKWGGAIGSKTLGLGDLSIR